MNIDVDSIKRKLLIKYPSFGSILANTEFQKDFDVGTAGTDGKVILYNPKFLNDLSEKEQVFIFAHEVCHIAFDHIFRSEGKNPRLWNIATDAVINALLQNDGLDMPTKTTQINGESKTVKIVIDIPEAINYDADEMYNKLLEEEKKKPKQQGQQGNQGQQEQQNSQEQQEETVNGYDAHSLWDKAIEERKLWRKAKGNQESKNSNESKASKGDKSSQENQSEQDSKKQQKGEEQKQEQGKQKDQESQEQKDEKESQEQQDQQGEQENKESKKEEKEKRENQEKSKFVEQGERETFKQIRIERRKQLEELSKELASKASQPAGNEIQREGKKLSDIGVAAPLIDWRRLLRQAIKYNEEWSRKNARMRNEYFRHRLEQIPIPEAEILLDTSGSVSEILLKNFLRECKNILNTARVKVGCFNTEFHGFTELRRPEDIDNMSFPIGGGTDFNAAVKAFSRKASNKIIFTDGEAPMPEETVRNVIWVVFGNRKINPKGGRVINITGEQLEKLYKLFIKDDLEDDISR